MNKIAELCLFVYLFCFVSNNHRLKNGKLRLNVAWVILHINKMKRIFRSPARPLCSRHRHFAIIESFPCSFVSALALPVA